ncbi:hypothetical protein Patl1_17060 [Pistacia atlantica]|uniref:Uncharacterized protein n=1 Tax=Pistacia atlantica TaxID=434234 RepID=A0ACC1BA28_9ROSI|nr:hypothetical protein Patl1_17060 [Pistacia atlantica]
MRINSPGKSLTSAQLYELAKKGGEDNLINVLLTSADVTVEGFCQGRCGTHGPMHGNTNSKFNYIWVGNSEIQCPGLCAWPFHESINGPKTPPLKAPNGDIGLDDMVNNVANLLAGTVTNPFGNGFFQGPKKHPWRHPPLVLEFSEKGLTLDLLEPCSLTPKLVRATMPMVSMEKSICFLL